MKNHDKLIFIIRIILPRNNFKESFATIMIIIAEELILILSISAPMFVSENLLQNNIN